MLTKLIFFAGTGVVGDYILNAASLVWADNKTLGALRPYWAQMGDGLGALSAGLTTLTAGLIVLLLAAVAGLEDLLPVLLLALLVGFVGDILIGRSDIFGPALQTWYCQVGSVRSAIYGALAIALTIMVGESVERWFLTKK